MKRFLNFGSRFRIGSHRGLASGSGSSLESGSSFGSVIPALAAEKQKIFGSMKYMEILDTNVNKHPFSIRYIYF